MSRSEELSDTPPPALTDQEQPPSSLQRSLRRAGKMARRCWRIADNLPREVVVFALLLLPFFVLFALTADLLAFLFGGMGRAIVSWTAIFALLGLALGLFVGGEAIAVLAITFGAGGFLLGLTLGFLCGPIFQKLPERLDQQLNGSHPG